MNDRPLRPQAPSLSVCIPWYGVDARTLEECLESALSQLPEDAELILLPDGPEASRLAHSLRLSGRVAVYPSEERIGMVANWNRAFNLSHGSLIHILHCDDVVAPGFYCAIAALARGFPSAVLYASAAGDLDRSEVVARGAVHEEPTLLVGTAAARFLLEDPRHGCGNVVYTRIVVARMGLFRDEFDFCPDEEALLRYSAEGPLALDPRPLYLQRTHARQARLSAWRRDDFVEVYVESRLAGARNFGADVMCLARESTIRRVVSIAMALALAGERTAARSSLRELTRCLPEARGSFRVRIARVAITRPLHPMVRARRRFALRRSGIRPKRLPLPD
jgi:hypothetical protein